MLARPLSGFAETFSQYIVEVSAGGGSDLPEHNPEAEGVLFVVEGQMTLTIGDEEHKLETGGYAFLPPGARWTLHNPGSDPAPLPLDPEGLSEGRWPRGAAAICHQRA